ncbi:MAG TPA: DUF1049 domain-containing protein [Anaeromyxobacter sp.]|nr:DUF1049 domain-containing protein [Anaeromyxobacter sp.]
MRFPRSLLLLALIAAALGFAAGYYVRDLSDDSLEHRTRAAAEHVREAFRSLTR